MKKILLDTNIVLDIALERGEFFKKAKNVVGLIYQKGIPIYVTATTITDIYYLLKKDKGHQSTIDFLINIFDFVDIAGVDKTAIINALNSGMNDFEDSVQTETAKQHDISVIITRNKKDFENSGLQIFSPDEYINKQKNN
ncbi:MAG: PIN domain-containing protein [Bacteroidota bacterium]